MNGIGNQTVKPSVFVARVLSACGALAALVPSVGHAHELRVSSYEMSEAGGVVLLESDAPIGEPWLRVESKSLKVWFPNVVDVARFDHMRDTSDPIRALLLRPGAANSAVVRIDVGTGRKLTRDNIEITRDGPTARIRVSFPVSAHTPVATPGPAIELTPAATAVAQVVSQPSAAKPLVLNGQAKPETAAAAASPAPPASKSRAIGGASASTTTNLSFAGGAGQNLGLLMLISAVLLGVYACLKKFGKPRTIRAQDIEVLSARRLGNRSELLLVRALGSDHLLVTSPGRIERVASAPSPIDPPLLLPSIPTLAAAPACAAAEADSQANGLGIITKFSSRSRLRKLLDAVDKESAANESDPPPPPPAAARDSRRPHAFGPELLSALNHHKLTGLSSLPSIASKQSEAVAGIARLRAGTRAN